MKKILIVSGHTNLNDSVMNREILNNLDKLLPNAQFSLLDKLYPNYKIDVSKEQEKLINADIIVLEFPIFWYNIPSLLQKWIEDVFTRGFSHGSNGDKLKGKKMLLSFTTGAIESEYSKLGRVGYGIDDLLSFVKATCNLCGIEYIGSVYTGGVSYQMRTDKNEMQKMLEKAKIHANKVFEIIKKISDDK